MFLLEKNLFFKQYNRINFLYNHQSLNKYFTYKLLNRDYSFLFSQKLFTKDFYNKKGLSVTRQPNSFQMIKLKFTFFQKIRFQQFDHQQLSILHTQISRLSQFPCQSYTGTVKEHLFRFTELNQLFHLPSRHHCLYIRACLQRYQDNLQKQSYQRFLKRIRISRFRHHRLKYK